MIKDMTGMINKINQISNAVLNKQYHRELKNLIQELNIPQNQILFQEQNNLSKAEVIDTIITYLNTEILAFNLLGEDMMIKDDYKQHIKHFVLQEIISKYNDYQRCLLVLLNPVNNQQQNIQSFNSLVNTNIHEQQKLLIEKNDATTNLPVKNIKKLAISECICQIQPNLYQKGDELEEEVIMICNVCSMHFHQSCLWFKQMQVSPEQMRAFKCPPCILSKQNQFHKVVYVLVQPELFMEKLYPTTVKFNIKQNGIAAMKESQRHLIEVRCLATNRLLTNHESEFPPRFHMTTNSQKTLANKTGVSTHSIGLVNKDHLQAGENKVQLYNLKPLVKNGTLPQSNRYMAGVYLVSTLEQDELKELILNAAAKPASRTKKLIVDTLSPQFGACTVSLLDPMHNGKLMSIPVKGKFCSHIECFCLDSFLTINHPLYLSKNMPSMHQWRCPICKVQCLEIVQDSLFKAILCEAQASERREYIRSVEFYYTGGHKLIVAEQSNSEYFAAQAQQKAKQENENENNDSDHVIELEDAISSGEEDIYQIDNQNKNIQQADNQFDQYILSIQEEQRLQKLQEDQKLILLQRERIQNLTSKEACFEDVYQKVRKFKQFLQCKKNAQPLDSDTGGANINKSISEWDLIDQWPIYFKNSQEICFLKTVKKLCRFTITYPRDNGSSQFYNGQQQQLYKGIPQFPQQILANAQPPAQTSSNNRSSDSDAPILMQNQNIEQECNEPDNEILCI